MNSRAMRPNVNPDRERMIADELAWGGPHVHD